MPGEPLSPEVISRHLRRICPTLIVADAQKSAEFYRDKLGFKIMLQEESELFMMDRDGCRIFLKRGSTPSRIRNRDLCDDPNLEFYDLFIQCDSMPAFDALYAEFQKTMPPKLGPLEQWGGMRLFSLQDIDGYKLFFARSV